MLEVQENELALNHAKPNRIKLGGGCFMTKSQQIAREKLGVLYDLSLYRQRPGGIHVRTKPLLVGPSGCGKTQIVRWFSQGIAKEMLTINASSWIPIGARNENHSTLQIRKFVLEQWTAGGIIYIDELDKCLPHSGSLSDWAHGVFGEILAVLDADKRLVSMGWEEETLEAFKEAPFFVVGSGAWQHIKNDAVRSKMGFGHSETQNPYANLRSKFGIPDEITERFSTDIIFLTYPDKEDYIMGLENIYDDLNLPLLNVEEMESLAEQAAESNRGVRWLEGYLTNLLIQHPPVTEYPSMGAFKYLERPSKVGKGEVKRNTNELYQQFIAMLLDLSDAAISLETKTKLAEEAIVETNYFAFQSLLDGTTTNREKISSGILERARDISESSIDLAAGLMTGTLSETPHYEERWRGVRLEMSDLTSLLIDIYPREIRKVGILEEVAKVHNLCTKSNKLYLVLLGA